MSDDKPHKRELPLRIGGVMRCCVATLDSAMVTEQEGAILPCRYCKSRLRVRDGAWEWDSDAPEVQEDDPTKNRYERDL